MYTLILNGWLWFHYCKLHKLFRGRWPTDSSVIELDGATYVQLPHWDTLQLFEQDIGTLKRSLSNKTRRFSRISEIALVTHRHRNHWPALPPSLPPFLVVSLCGPCLCYNNNNIHKFCCVRVWICDRDLLPLCDVTVAGDVPVSLVSAQMPLFLLLWPYSVWTAAVGAMMAKCCCLDGEEMTLRCGSSWGGEDCYWRSRVVRGNTVCITEMGRMMLLRGRYSDLQLF